MCCSDSRTPAEIIFDQDIGDLFVIRVAGNVVAPSIIGSIEFATSAFGTSLVVVMGHTQCGAISTTLNQIENPLLPCSENVQDIVSRIQPHIYSIAKIPNLSFIERVALAAEANVAASVSQLSHSSRLLEEQVNKKQLKILGAVLDLASGKVSFLKN